MFNVYQHWDPLKVCIVGRSYPPEFYSWITVPHVRALFERIAIETEEDYQNIIKKLQEFGVEVLRPELPDHADDIFVNGRYLAPLMTPRDYTITIGEKFYNSFFHDVVSFYNNVKDTSWPICRSEEEFNNLPLHILNECKELHGYNKLKKYFSGYDKIFERIKSEGNEIHNTFHSSINGAMCARIGRDLYFGTHTYNENIDDHKRSINQEFTSTRNHIIVTGGHSDGTYCPVAPGLIISLHDVPTYKDTFPDWEVVYLPGQSWNKVGGWLNLKQKNGGKWWIPGFEQDQDVINCVEQWLGHWTGYVEETVFDVNMLIVDPKNVIVFNYNKLVFDALERYGITPHIVPFRHRYFWDGGIHCVTTDLHREGTMQDYFPQRG